MSFNEFLVQRSVSDQTEKVARLEIMICKFSESFKSIWCKVLEMQFSNLQKYHLDAIFVDYDETKTYWKKCYMRALHAQLTRAVWHARADFDIHIL